MARISTQTMRSTIGTQDVTVAGSGTPKGFMNVGSFAGGLNASVAGQGMCVGFSDLVLNNDHCGWITGEDNQASTNTARRMRTDESIHQSTAGDTSVTEEAAWQATITDGVRYNFTAASVARQFSTILFNEGIDQVDVASLLVPASGNTTITTGFQPDGIIAFAVGIDVVDANRNNVEYCLTFFDRVNDSYAASAFHAVDGVTTPSTAISLSNTATPVGVGNVGNQYKTVTFGSFTGTGYDVQVASGSSTRQLILFAFKMLPNYNVRVGRVNAPTSTGVTDLITGLTGTPYFALFNGNGCVNVGLTNRGGCFVGAASASEEFCSVGRHKDTGSPSNSDCTSYHYNNACLAMADDDDVVEMLASLDSFVSGTVRANFSTADRDNMINYMVLSNEVSGIPNLSAPTDAATSWDKSSGSVTSDLASGSVYAVVTTSATTPTHAQIVAAQDHTGATASAAGNVLAVAGVNNLAFEGLNENTQYYTHFTQDGPATPVSASGFTTPANQAPTLDTPIPDQVCQIGVPFGPLDVSGNFSDPDGDDLTFSQTGLPNGLTISSAGIISGTPTGGFQ